MVYFFKAFTAENDELGLGLGESKTYDIYMGKDKFENDPLIRKSHPKNLWFHVDKHSSAHVYLQLSQEQQSHSFQDLAVEAEILDQIAQLTKANSIKASKLNNITIIYTPVDNLRTDGLMDTGTVTFVNPQKLKRIHIAKKENSVINKLNKTKTEVSTEQFVHDQQEMISAWQKEKKAQERQQAEEDRNNRRLHEEQKKRNADPYGDIFTEENMRASSNAFRNENWVEDEFW